MTVDELCKQRDAILRALAWIELEIIRARAKEAIKAKQLNDAAEYFPRVRGI